MKGRKPSDGPAVVVAPKSCCLQWIQEIKDKFKEVWPSTIHTYQSSPSQKLTAASQEKAVRTLLLEDKSISPFDPCKYDVIVTSYKFVQSEQSRLDKFKQQMQDYRDGTSDVVPKRPRCSPGSGIWTALNHSIGSAAVLEVIDVASHQTMTEQIASAQAFQIASLSDKGAKEMASLCVLVGKYLDMGKE